MKSVLRDLLCFPTTITTLLLNMNPNNTNNTTTTAPAYSDAVLDLGKQFYAAYVAEAENPTDATAGNIYNLFLHFAAQLEEQTKAATAAASPAPALAIPPVAGAPVAAGGGKIRTRAQTAWDAWQTDQKAKGYPGLAGGADASSDAKKQHVRDTYHAMTKAQQQAFLQQYQAVHGVPTVAKGSGAKKVSSYTTFQVLHSAIFRIAHGKGKGDKLGADYAPDRIARWAAIKANPAWESSIKKEMEGWCRERNAGADIATPANLEKLRNWCGMSAAAAIQPVSVPVA